MYGMADGSEGSWYAVTVATDGVDFDMASPVHARPIESLGGVDAPQLTRISCPASLAAMAATLLGSARVAIWRH
jgi:hypothetical protein